MFWRTPLLLPQIPFNETKVIVSSSNIYQRQDQQDKPRRICQYGTNIPLIYLEHPSLFLALSRVAALNFLTYPQQVPLDDGLSYYTLHEVLYTFCFLQPLDGDNLNQIFHKTSIFFFFTYRHKYIYDLCRTYRSRKLQSWGLRSDHRELVVKVRKC